jgi:aminoglycoside phosphotransferase (APT) family kinase protein
LDQNATTSDAGSIRAGEELDTVALQRYLNQHLEPIPALNSSPNSAVPAADLRIEQFPGGHSNLTYLLKVRGREFVLRRPPFGPVAPTAHDMPREYRLLQSIHPVFSLAPRPYLLCEDLSVIGAPFYLMERRRGLVIRRETPVEIGVDLALRRRVSEAMIDTLARLHEVDIYATSLVNIGKPKGFVSRQVRGWADRWQRSKTDELPEIDKVVAWLSERLPPDADPDTTSASERPTLVHNDFKLDNVMLDPHEPSRVVAVLDWEMCTVGDPLVDLGIFLCYWPQIDDPESRRESISPVTTEPGWMTRAELINRYAARTGRDVSAVAFYEVFALFKIAVVLQQIYFRYVRGQTHDDRFKEFGRRVSGLAREALDSAIRSGI